MRTLHWLFLLTALPAAVSIAQIRTIEELKQLYDYDSKLPLEIRETLIRENRSLVVKDITFASPKGGRATAYLVLPAGSGHFPAIVFGHWGYGTRTEFLPEAALYAEAGVVSLMVDYPWVRPAPWRKSLRRLDKPEWDSDLYIQAVVDLRRSIDLLATYPFVDTTRIAYIGHSYGAQWGAILSAVEKRLKACVLVGGVASTADVWLENDDPDLVEFRRTTPRQKIEEYLEAVGPNDAIHYVPHAFPTPLLFQFARFERFFDEASMNRYAEAASAPKLVKWYDAGHELNDLQALLDRAEWLQSRIGGRSIKSVLLDQLGQKSK